MINLIKVNKGDGPNLQIGEYDFCYKLVKDNEGIGYGTINKDQENQLFIFIDKQQRGNGYGKILFSKMLEETKNQGYNQVKILFEKENIPMQKIANDNGAQQISEDKNNVKYIISIKWFIEEGIKYKKSP